MEELIISRNTIFNVENLSLGLATFYIPLVALFQKSLVINLAIFWVDVGVCPVPNRALQLSSQLMVIQVEKTGSRILPPGCKALVEFVQAKSPVTIVPNDQSLITIIPNNPSLITIVPCDESLITTILNSH